MLAVPLRHVSTGNITNFELDRLVPGTPPTSSQLFVTRSTSSWAVAAFSCQFKNCDELELRQIH